MITLNFTNVQDVNAAKIDKSPVNIALVSASSATNSQDKILLGVEILIDAGWKIYAPNNNDDLSTRHPEFVWNDQDNVTDITIKWPQAHILRENNADVPVYNSRILIPLSAQIIDPNQPVHLNGLVTLISCSNQCLPVEQTISITVPVGSGSPTAYAAELIKLQNQTPNLEATTISADKSLLWMVIIAFMGGVILNFMPCVLPVLSLKLKFLIAKQTALYRLNFVATCVGILASFLMFALIAIGLRQSGHLFGWGSHFQEPYFIIFMCIIMVVFVCNIWGCLELILPRAIQSPLNRFANIKFDQSQVAAEGFVSGIIATLLATPCTAPFLGTAIGYALSKGNFEIIILFTIMGLGFSFPYLLALILPPKYLPVPKPGRWMTIMSKILAISLLGTAIWLLWILNQTKGPTITLVVSSSLGLLVAILYLLKPGNRWRYLAWACVINAFFCTFYLESGKHQIITKDISAEHWQPFNEQAIEQALSCGKIVLIDVTASWCTTCHLNKLTVFNRSDFIEYIASPQVIAMRADWTQRDASIGKFLAKHQRHGIPFNIIYGPKAPHGIILPELLDLENIIQAFNNAGFNK